MKSGNPIPIRARRGSTLLATTILISALTVLLLSMLAAGVEGTRAVSNQDDDWRLTSAAESAGSLAAQHLWTGYLRDQGGVSGDIGSFRRYLDAEGILDDGPGGIPSPTAGVDLLQEVGLPNGSSGGPELDQARVEELRVVRRDDGDATQLFVSVAARTPRGDAMQRAQPAHALQMAYTIEPAPFSGFDYAILTKNVNCVFCHTVIDSTQRAFDTDPAHYGTFDKVKVGSLESLMLRHLNRPGITDAYADSLIAGTVYSRGTMTDQRGVEFVAGDWPNLTARSAQFDAAGHLIQTAVGALVPNAFHPAGMPLGAGENLYLDYPTVYADQPDGLLPASFPPPFPDDGGIDPVTGEPTSFGALNRSIDPNEFFAVAQDADGSIASGIVNVSAPGTAFSTQVQFNRALAVGNQTSLGAVTTGNVILTGTATNPIVIEGTIAIDGDVIIQGWIRGTGSIVASGNVYLPGDLRYLDGRTYMPGDTPGNPTGPPTYGIAQDGTQNTLGLAAGGNLMVGDYLRPSSAASPGLYDIVTGDPTGAWNFALAEISLFNRAEWAHTQPMLPAHGEDPHAPSTWSVPNPSYLGPTYVPRYYQFGPGDEVPIYNLGDLYFDAATQTWLGGEVPLAWDTSLMTLADPANTNDHLLYDASGRPIATVLQVTPDRGWVPDAFYKHALESIKAARPAGDPMRVDGLLYTNNAIFGMVNRNDRMQGKLVINGSIVCADLGLLAPGYRVPGGADNVPGSPYSVGLRLNYDERTKGMLNVRNPFSVEMRRTLWRPTAMP